MPWSSIGPATCTTRRTIASKTSTTRPTGAPPASSTAAIYPRDIPTGLRSSSRSGSPTGWAGLEFDSPNYSTDVNLAPGHPLTLHWEAIKGAHWWNGRKYVPGHGCGDKDYRNCPAIGPILEPYNRVGGPTPQLRQWEAALRARLHQRRI